MSIQQILKEAEKLQAKMQEAQKELEKVMVTGEAGGGAVKIQMTAKFKNPKVTLAKDIFDGNDKEMLEDLITSALNDLTNKIDKETQGKIQSLTNGVKLPGNLNDLF